MARDVGLDLLEISPMANPPVCKIMDYGKYKYELEKRAKEAKKKQHVVEVKEVKVRYKIDTHDYQVRINNIKKFISQGNKVKIVISKIICVFVRSIVIVYIISIIPQYLTIRC